MARLAISVLCAALCAACGASSTDVVIECPSPDGSATAILFLQMGGGGAGFVSHTLAIQPANLGPTLPGRFGGGPSVEVLRIDEAESMTLDWKDPGRLDVDFAISSLATVFHMFHQYPIVGDRQVRVLFSERERSDDRRREFTCRSAGRETINPPLKRLFIESSMTARRRAM